MIAEQIGTPTSLREAANGGWVVVPKNFPADTKIQPDEVVQIVYRLNPSEHDHGSIIGFFLHESIVKNEEWYKAFEDKLFDTFPELEEAANAFEEVEPDEEPNEPAAAPSFPGFSLKEIADFDFAFLKDYGVRYQQSQDGEPSWVVLTKEGVKQFRKFDFWKKNIHLPPHELDGRKFAAQMSSLIASQGGKFLQDDVDGYHILIHNRRIPIDATSDAMKKFLQDVCGITSLSVASAMAVERLRIEGYGAASHMKFRQLSAMYNDRVYLPITAKGKLLLVEPKGISLVPNGDNRDALWLEHPEHNPFEYRAPSDVLPVLQMFQEFFVDSQACAVPAMQWFVAMAEGLFPIVRDTCPSNRFIVLHIGEKGHGKTTGAKSLVLLHGFEDVMGDVSVAALSGLPEQGLVVCDNKESRNFTQPLIDYFLRLATGGKFLRCVDGGKGVRRSAPLPVGVITSIEGVQKSELHDRIVKVKYFLTKAQQRLDRDSLEDAQRTTRNQIMSAIAVVIQEYLRVRVDPKVSITARPIERFNRHFRELCYLLIAYGRVTRGVDAGDAWAKEIIEAWDHEILETRGDGAEDAPVSALEAPILEIVTTNGTGHVAIPFTWEDRKGRMYTIHPGDLLLALKRNLALQRDLPQEPAQFSQRLGSERFERFVVVRDTKQHPVPELKRVTKGARLGIFIPDDVAEVPVAPGAFIERFVEERCVVEPNATQETSSMYNAYLTWAVKPPRNRTLNDVEPQREFEARLAERGFEMHDSLWIGVRVSDVSAM